MSETKRQLVEILVGGIEVTTVEQDGRRASEVNVIYSLTMPETSVETRTPGGS